MQIRGLHRVVCRGARLASRLEAPALNAAAERHDTLARWCQARRDGLNAKAVAAAVAMPISALYRWQRLLEPKSTRPHTVRKAHHDPKLVIAIERGRIARG